MSLGTLGCEGHDVEADAASTALRGLEVEVQRAFDREVAREAGERAAASALIDALNDGGVINGAALDPSDVPVPRAVFAEPPALRVGSARAGHGRASGRLTNVRSPNEEEEAP